MNTIRTCPQCSQPMPDDAPQGLCPQCLMAALLETQAMPPGSTPSRELVDISDPAEVAKRLPQFEIIELLGRGGMGVVYKARQPQLDRMVAIKILPPEDSGSPDFVARFTREARSLAKLNHPNIVSVYDFGESNGLYYFLMEFVDGANLRQLMQAKKLTADEALAIVPKVCDALEYAHEEGVVHRDIKPENILVDKKGRVKIADFGLARLLRREALDMTLTLAGTTLGTLRYMAPEQMDKPESVDHRADIYSLGVVFYEMLTGEIPAGRFQLPSQKAQVDVRLDEIVMHTLEKEPERRYQHASEVRTDLENVTGKSGTASAVPSAASVPSRDDHVGGSDALDILKGVLLVIQSLAWLGIGLGVLGMASAAAAAGREGGGADAMAALWDRVLLFGWVIGSSLLAVAMLAKAKRDGRRPFALAAALLVFSNCGFLGVLSQGLWNVPWHVSLLIGCIAAFCIVILLCGSGIGPDIPAAFSALAASRQKQSLAEPHNPGLDGPRLGRMALAGAIWAVFALFVAIPSALFSMSVRVDGSAVQAQPNMVFIVFICLLLLIGSAAPIGTTILGAVAMNQIKKSGGKLYGLPLAFADMVFFPMLLVCGGIALLIALALRSILPVPFVGGLAIGILVACVVAFVSVRALWRKVAGKPTASADSKDDWGKKLNLAAIGLLLAGIVNAFAGLIWIGSSFSALTGAMALGAPIGWLVVKLLLSLGSIAVVYYTIGSAMFLMHRNDDGDITFPLIMAAIVPPGCVFGLPAAIYALVLLSRPEVKALFTQSKPEPEPAVKKDSFGREASWFGRSQGVQKVMSVMLGVVFVLSLFCFFSFRMQVTTTADHSGVVRNLYDVTVGLGDPWLYLIHHKTGTRGGMNSGMNFVAGSALFGLAALFAGTALTRLTREQKRRAKLADVPTDIPQRRFFWQAIAGIAFFIAGGAGVIVHQARIDLGPRWVDAKQTHPDFTRPGVTSLALKKEIAEELMLAPAQLEQIDAALSRAYLDFLRLENDHSLFRSVKGHLVKEVKPFPDRSFDLAQLLAKELRDIAGKDIIDTPVRGEVWKLRLFGHAGEFNVRAEIWQQDGKFHVEDVWERDGQKITGKSEGIDSLRFVGNGSYVLDWEAQKDILGESKPDEETIGYSKGWDTMLVFIGLVRKDKLAQMLATDPKAVRTAADPRAALVTQASTPVGRACAETQLKLHGLPFAEDATAEDLLKKLEQLLGAPPAP